MLRFVFVDWSPQPHENHEQEEHLNFTDSCQYPLMFPVLAKTVTHCIS